MLRLTFKNIWAHKMRLMLSMVSIFLGVAFLSGTLVFTSTIQKSFNDLFTSASKNTDVSIMVKNDAIDEFGSTQNREDVPRTILNEVQTIDGVKEAEGNIGNMDSGALIVIDDKGKRIFPSQGPPIFGVNQPHSAILTPWLLVDSKGDNKKYLVTMKCSWIKQLLIHKVLKLEH